jgi:hypothetical protein
MSFTHRFWAIDSHLGDYFFSQLTRFLNQNHRVRCNRSRFAPSDQLSAFRIW